jgi:hypothetical protein
VRIAAVVLNYRTPSETTQAVAALQASGRPPQEIVVIDNDSGDHSEQYLRDHLRGVDVIQSGTNLGFSGGCNVGVRRGLATGADAILFVNSDAILAPDCLGRLENAVASGRVGIAGPVIFTDSERSRIESAGIRYSTWTGRMAMHDRFADLALARSGVLRVDAVSGAIMLVKCEVFEAVGLFAEEFFYSFEDIDLCLRARAAGYETIVVTGAAAVHTGSHSIGASSPRRLYFAARNHLLLAARTARRSVPGYALLVASIVLLNLAHALIRSKVPAFAALQSVFRGTRAHFQGRYGSDARESGRGLEP